MRNLVKKTFNGCGSSWTNRIEKIQAIVVRVNIELANTAETILAEMMLDHRSRYYKLLIKIANPINLI